MLWTTIPGFGLALLIYAMLGSFDAAAPPEIAALQAALAEQFNIGVHLLLPLLLMLALVYKRMPAYPAIVISALVGVVFALLFQPGAVIRLAGDSGDLGPALVLFKGAWISLFDGYTSDSGNAFLDELLSKGGMSSMLNTVWLIVCALGLGGVLERTGILAYLLQLALRGVNSVGSLISVTVLTCFGTNILAADQYISIALPGRMFKGEYERQGLSTLNLSRTLEDSGTLTSALIPWNTCGAYMSATLGVATLSYVPFAFFNLLCPLIAIIYGFGNIAIKPLATSAEPAPVRTQ